MIKSWDLIDIMVISWVLWLNHELVVWFFFAVCFYGVDNPQHIFLGDTAGILTGWAARG